MDRVRFNQEFLRRRFEMRYGEYKDTITHIEFLRIFFWVGAGKMDLSQIVMSGGSVNSRTTEVRGGG